MSVEMRLTVRRLGALRGQVASRAPMAEVGLSQLVFSELELAKVALEEATPEWDPSDPDNAKRSWRVVLAGPRVGRVVNTSPHASFLFTGASPRVVPPGGRPMPITARGSNLAVTFAYSAVGFPPNAALTAVYYAQSWRIRKDFRAIAGKASVAAVFGTGEHAMWHL